MALLPSQPAPVPGLVAASTRPGGPERLGVPDPVRLLPGGAERWHERFTVRGCAGPGECSWPRSSSGCCPWPPSSMPRSTGHLSNALRLAVGRLGVTVLALVIAAAPAIVFWGLPASRAAVAWFMVLIGPAFQTYLIALLQRSTMAALRGAPTSES